MKYDNSLCDGYAQSTYRYADTHTHTCILEVTYSNKKITINLKDT